MSTLIKPPCFNPGNATVAVTNSTSAVAQQQKPSANGFLYISGALSLHELFYCAAVLTPNVRKEQVLQLMQACNFSMFTESDDILTTVKTVNRKMLDGRFKVAGVIQAMPPSSGDLYNGCCTALLNFCKTVNFAVVFNPMPKGQYNGNSIYAEEFRDYDTYRKTNILVAEALGTYLTRSGIEYHSGMVRTINDKHLEHFSYYIKQYT